MVVMQRHPVDDTAGRAGDPNPHTFGSSKAPAIERDPVVRKPISGNRLVSGKAVTQGVLQRAFDMMTKEQGRLARWGSENGSVPLSSYPSPR